MGYLAFGHPFMDGNGRTLMVVHAADQVPDRVNELLLAHLAEHPE
jgi:fido (protein-threonine AMPylation protein)